MVSVVDAQVRAWRSRYVTGLDRQQTLSGILLSSDNKNNDYNMNGKMMSEFSIGDRVVLSDDAQDNEQYQDFGLVGVELVVASVAFNRSEHGGYDEGIGCGLYDLRFVDGRDVPVSLYAYELETA